MSVGALKDLDPFRIQPSDIDVRPITSIDFDKYAHGKNFSGYKIPYYGIDGKPVNHFRIRQLPNLGNPTDRGGIIRTSELTRIYFPIGFKDSQRRELTISAAASTTGVAQTYAPLFIVDDERLAAQIQRYHRYPAVAIQGPAGWKTSEGLAEGFTELCEFTREHEYTLVLWIGDGTDKNIQREVANLAMEFKFRGIAFKNIRQYTHHQFGENLLRRVLNPPSMFPQHPNIRSYIGEKMEEAEGRLSRKDCQEVALAVLADMEANGTRIRSTTTSGFYYFDKGTLELTEASLSMSGKELMDNSAFMSSIYNKYGLSPSDANILRWFSTQFMSEEPIQRTTSYRVMMCEPRQVNTFALQVSSSHFIHFGDGKPLAKLVQNGDYGILFENTAIKSVNTELLMKEITKQREVEVMPFWWLDVVKETRLQEGDRFKILLALLYYVSPWLKGWREIQLPIEVITGEAGTGKSSLFALRLSILTGDPELQGLPDTLRNWHTSVANTSGMAVFDNVHLANKTLRQTLSDEMCRLVTEPRPTITMRQLYKTAEIAKLPLQCTFCVTAIENVFTNIDFIQRSIITRLERPYGQQGEEVLYGGWVKEKLEQRGGREAWLAHHIVVLERFFKVVGREWDDGYKSKTRLINFEQTLTMMAKVFGIDADWLPDLLRDTSRKTAIEIDWVLEGLVRFSDYWMDSANTPNFSASDVADWASGEDDFENNVTLTNARRLGRYISHHKTVVHQTTGIIIVNQKQQRASSYAIVTVPGSRERQKPNTEKDPTTRKADTSKKQKQKGTGL